MKKLISVILVLVMAFSLMACAGGNNARPAPTEPDQQAEETSEPTAAPDDTDMLSECAWEIDADNDGTKDRVILDEKELGKNGSTAPIVMLSDGSVISLPQVSVSHAGMATYGLTELDGKDCLLCYRTSWYSGACEDNYCLYTVEDGALCELRSGGVEFEVSSVRPLDPVNVDEVLKFVDEINELWQHSRVLFSTDTDIAMKQMFDPATGHRAVIEGNYYAASEGERYYCYEQLERMDAEFGLDDPSTDTVYTARQRLELANEIMAENTAAVTTTDEWFIDEAWKLVQEINNIYGTDFVKEECDVYPAQWGVKTLRWYKPDPESAVHVSFVQNDDASWTTGMDHCTFYYEYSPDRIDSEKYGNDIVELFGLSLDLTENDLKKAGYSPTGGEGDLDMAAEYMANYVAKLFTDLPDDNYFKCSDAGVSLFEKHVTPSYTHWVNVALMPVDYSNWGVAYGDIMNGLCAEPEYYGYITIFMNIMAERNSDGSIHVYLNWDE